MSRVYAVTGVASGIGAALAAQLRQAGHWVIGFDVQHVSENLDQFIALDLNDPASIDAAVAQVDRPLDGLCNNAGLPPREGLETAILHVNFVGQRRFTQGMLPHLQDGGSIVNMASRAGHGWRDNLDQVKRLAGLRTPEQVAEFVSREKINATRCYNLSKEAMLLWTVALTEPILAQGLRVNSLSPGGVSTGILDDFRKAFGDQMARNVARAGRPGNAEEIARIAAFVMSPDSNWLKGADIPIDGGMGAFNMTGMLGLDVLLADAQAQDM